MMKQFRLNLILIAGCAIGIACDANPTGPIPGGNGLYVLNEGAFGQSNAEITLYSFDEGTARQNIFSSANPGKTLGDVANQILIENGVAFVVVNNSQKIELIRTDDNTSLGTIALTRSPRQIAVASTSKAYVTNMDSTVSVVNLPARQVDKDIVVGAFPEAIVMVGKKAYVAVGGFGSGRTVCVIDTELDEVVKTIETRDGPSYLVRASDGFIYVSCTGSFDFSNPANDTDGAIMAIDPESDSLVDSIDVQGHLGKIAAGGDGSLYVIGPGSFTGGPLWKIGTGPLRIIDQDFIPGTYYGVGVSAQSGDIFAADAKGFGGRGTVSIYSASGFLKTEFDAGIGPTWFATN